MKLYLNEIVTLKENNQTVVSPTATYENENSEEASRLAAINFHSKVSYNLQQKAIQKDFLVYVITETGTPVPDMKKFYRFAEESQPEPTPEEPVEE